MKKIIRRLRKRITGRRRRRKYFRQKRKEKKILEHVIANAEGALNESYSKRGEIFATGTYTKNEYEIIKKYIQEINMRGKKAYFPFKVILHESKLDEYQVLYRYLEKPSSYC